MTERLVDLVVVADDQPGVLRRLAHTLGHAEINIEGLSALTGNGRAVVHILVQDDDRALMALAAAGHEAKACRDAVVVNVADRPDAFAAVLEPIERAGVNIEHAYLAVGTRAQTRVVLVVDDPSTTRALLRATTDDDLLA